LGYRASKGAVVSAVIDQARSTTFDEDIVLVERYLSGDQAGFEMLYAKYYDKVLAIARGVLMDQDEPLTPSKKSSRSSTAI